MVDMIDVFLSKTAPNRYSRTTQDAQNDIPARPQGDERLRTTLEEKRVSARRGRAGEKKVIFSILLRPILRCFGIAKQ